MKFADAISVFVLSKKLIRNGGCSIKRLHVVGFYYLKLALTEISAIPLRLFYGKKINRKEFSEPPVFILGHFRSGTTYLHKLMASDTRFGFLSNYDILCPNISMLAGDRFGKFLQRITEFFRIKNYHFNNSVHQLFDPGEEDMYLISKGSSVSAYWGFIFPEAHEQMFVTDSVDSKTISKWKQEYLYTLKFATCRCKGKRLILKNPPNTGRIKLLLELFPDARFIYIHRNPFDLYYSMNNLWTKVITKYYSLQNLNQDQIDKAIYDYYSRLIERYEQEKHLVPKGNLIEISYDELESSPFETIYKIYDELRLPAFAFMEPALTQRLEQEQQYKKFSYSYENRVLDKTASAWMNEIRKRKYNRPTISPV